MTIYNKLKFNKLFDKLCKIAAWQLNVLYRLREIIDIKEKEIMHNTSILSNFNYCPIIWHFYGKTASKKV